jgi:predicted ATPase/class 3 adenylate cyclase
VRAPSGTVTFLFTDIEGSTRRWEADAAGMRSDLARHDEVIRDAVEHHGGVVFATGGDGFATAFGRAGDALSCAIEVRSALIEAGLPAVRMGVHTGEAEERGGDYFGPAVNRAARLTAIGNGGQVLVSHATEQLVRDHLAEGLVLVDHGEHRLRDLSSPERVFELREPGSGAQFPPLRSLDVLRTNLPVQLTSFVGRAGDVATVGELVREQRAVTLTGVGGVGKTRLALQVAADLLDDYPDGVWLVELAPVGEDGRVIETIAAVMGVEPPPSKTIEQSLLDAVRGQAVLVVVDNCEHLLEEACRVVGLLVRTAPKLAVLATSREPMGLPGEHTVALRSLDAGSAVQLFRDRAVAVDSSFVLAESGVAAVEHLCRRLDGMPLAIELAAARVRMFSPAELAERLDQRFRLLTGGRGAVERHHTLRAAIDWSYELLPDRDRVVFQRLSVFAGGCTLHAAQAVCASDEVEDLDVVDALASLIDKSLVIAEHTTTGTRYGQLETIRQYAEEHLLGSGLADAVRERHARYFGGFAREAGHQLWGTDELDWSRRVEADLGNIRAAVSWAVAAGETDLAMRIAGALVNQAMERPIWATASIAEHAWRAPGADRHPWRAIVMGEASFALLRRGEMQGAAELVDQALDAQRAGARFSAAVWSYGMVYRPDDKGADSVMALAAEALERAEAAGDELGAIALRASYALALSGFAMDGSAPGTEALPQAERALADARALRQPALIAMGLLARGQVLLLGGSHAEGLSLLRECVDLSSRIGSSWTTIAGQTVLAAAEARYGDAARGADLIRSVLVSARENGDFFFQSGAAHVSLAVFNRYGRPDLVARFDGALGSSPRYYYGTWRAWYLGAVMDGRATLGDEQYEALKAAGTAIPSELLLAEIIRGLDALLEDGPHSASPRVGPAQSER